MGHVGNPRSFRLTHHRLGKPLSGSLTSLLEHRLRYWGRKSDLFNTQLTQETLPKAKNFRSKKIRRLSRMFSGSLLSYLTNVRGKLLYEHPSWRQLWYPGNYRGSYPHYHHLWKQSADVVSRKSSLIRPTQRRLRISPFGYYSHSYFLGKADGSFLSKPMFVSRFLESRDSFEYQFPDSKDPADKVPEEDSDTSEPADEPLRSVPAQPAPGFTFDPYLYRNKRTMSVIAKRFPFFFKDLMVEKALKKNRETTRLFSANRLDKVFTFGYRPQIKASAVIDWRRTHMSFTTAAGLFPVNKLRPLSKNHSLFDFFNFLSFKTNSFTAIPKVTPISSLCKESLSLFARYNRRTPPVEPTNETKLTTYYKHLKEYYQLSIKRKAFKKEILDPKYKPTEEQFRNSLALRKEISEHYYGFRNFDQAAVRPFLKLRRFQQAPNFAEVPPPLLRRIYSSKRFPAKKAQIRAKLPSQTVNPLGSKGAPKVKPKAGKKLPFKVRKVS